MNNFYSQLLSGQGSRRVKYKGTIVSSESHKTSTTTTIKTTYGFVGDTKLTKETISLLDQSTKVIKLTKVEIVRTTHVKDVSIVIRFLNDDNILIFSEPDLNLLTMSDTKILEKLNIEIT